MAMKPASVSSSVLAPRLDTATAVGSTPSITHGWRPNSATSQPDSMAIHGSGIASTASFSSQRWLSSLRRADSHEEGPRQQ
jgi:hypothetical protein